MYLDTSFSKANGMGLAISMDRRRFVSMIPCHSGLGRPQYLEGRIRVLTGLELHCRRAKRAWRQPWPLNSIRYSTARQPCLLCDLNMVFVAGPPYCAQLVAESSSTTVLRVLFEYLLHFASED